MLALARFTAAAAMQPLAPRFHRLLSLTLDETVVAMQPITPGFVDVRLREQDSGRSGGGRWLLTFLAES